MNAGTRIDNVEADEFAKRRLLCDDGLEAKISTLIINLLFLAAGKLAARACC
jgi:hypothetical protein